jgi:hypothetical protein
LKETVIGWLCSGAHFPFSIFHFLLVDREFKFEVQQGGWSEQRLKDSQKLAVDPLPFGKGKEGKGF